MEIPGSVPKWLFAGAWTAGLGTAVIVGHCLGADRPASRFVRWWANGLVRACGLSLQVFGAEQVDWARTYVIMANHQSQLDVLALIAAVPFVPGFLAKHELRAVPVLGKAMESAGHVFVDRKNHSRAVHALDEAADRMKTGRSIVIFPEGTRGDGHSLRSFKKGGFHLARRAGVPVLPMGVRGTAELLGRHGKQIRAGKAEVHIGRAIEPEEIARLSVDELIAQVRATISDLSGIPLDSSAPAQRPST